MPIGFALFRCSLQCRSGPGSDFHAVKRSELADRFRRCTHERTSVVWKIDFKRGVHVLIGVAGGRVFHRRDFIAEFRVA